MTFEVPKSEKDKAENRFPFRHNGKTCDIPLLKFAPVAAAEAFEEGRTVAGLLLCCESDEARDAIRSFDSTQLEAFSEAWEKASGIESGESEGSTDS